MSDSGRLLGIGRALLSYMPVLTHRWKLQSVGNWILSTGKAKTLENIPTAVSGPLRESERGGASPKVKEGC